MFGSLYCNCGNQPRVIRGLIARVGPHDRQAGRQLPDS
jgi:hypothetical protein